MTTKYMHTINGKPAGFRYDSIVYNRANGRTTWVTLCDSLAEIRRHQRISKKSWDKYGYPWMGDDQFKYGYVRILV